MPITFWKFVVVNSTEETNEDKSSDSGSEAAHYRTERDLRAALVPLSSRLFEQMNGQVGGLKFLVDLRADLKNTLEYGLFHGIKPTIFFFSFVWSVSVLRELDLFW